ncbi:MAG: C39 family peptidase [Saprospiraceae bacterium]|nr:C39 family peptidase [Lewinella sp.]
MSIYLFDLAGSAKYESGQLNKDGHSVQNITALQWNKSQEQKGAVKDMSTKRLEDSKIYSKVIHMHPMWTSQGTLKAWFPWKQVPDVPVFKAQIGFIQGASHTDGVTFWVWEHHKENGREVWNPILKEHKKYTGELQDIEIDLAKFSSQQMSIELRVDAGKSSGQDWAVWVNPRIEGIPVDGFMIQSISVEQFPVQRFGKYFDSSGNRLPDLYIRWEDQKGKKLGTSEKKTDCDPRSRPVFAGDNMPFRILSGHRYTLQLLDYDKDGRIRKNEDEAISIEFPVNVGDLVRQQGIKSTYRLIDPVFRDVILQLNVAYRSRAELEGRSVYLRHVMPINQEILPYNPERLEGCGPVAAAMLMGYWQTELGYQIMDERDHFNGRQHPTHTIREFYRVSNSKKSPGKNNKQSFTAKRNMKDGLGYFAKKANNHPANAGKPKIHADILWSARRWPKIKAALHKELRDGNPVILLFKSIPACLKKYEKRVNETFAFADHYVLAVGFNDDTREYYIINGWAEFPNTVTSGPHVHYGDQYFPLCVCSYKEVENSNPSIVYLKR